MLGVFCQTKQNVCYLFMIGLERAKFNMRLLVFDESTINAGKTEASFV